MLRLLRRSYQPLNTILISADNLSHNYRYLSSLNKKITIAPVLKSNAYGHGLIQVATILEKLKPPFFCVDSLFEGYELLKAGIKTPILIMGFVHSKSLQTKKLPFSFAVSSYEVLKILTQYQPQVAIHLFVDTGMHREGIPLQELEKSITYIKTTGLKVEGLMSHLAMADKPDNKLTQSQFVNFQKAYHMLQANRINPQWLHMDASAGYLHHAANKNDISNLARVGIAIYGIDPEGQNRLLRPALDFKTTIAQIKTLKKGERIGYDFTFTAPRNLKIAVLPVGYNDGVDRDLSNKGFAYVKGKACPIIGRVSMNITTIDVSKIKHLSEGEEATIFSHDLRDKNSIVQAAKICNVIPYEILIHLHPSTRRLILENNI